MYLLMLTTSTASVALYNLQVRIRCQDMQLSCTVHRCAMSLATGWLTCLLTPATSAGRVEPTDT